MRNPLLRGFAPKILLLLGYVALFVLVVLLIRATLDAIKNIASSRQGKNTD